MRIRCVDHEVTKLDSTTVRIRFVEIDDHGFPIQSINAFYNQAEIEMLITYLKGMRDGMGWNACYNKDA